MNKDDQIQPGMDKTFHMIFTAPATQGTYPPGDMAKVGQQLREAIGSEQ